MNNSSWLGTGSEQDIINIKTNLTGGNGTYEEMINALAKFQSKFVQPLSTMWACKDAQDFGMILDSSISRLLSDINNAFVDFFGVIDQAGRAWASSFQTTYVAINFQPRVFKLDVSLFRENMNGIRGIDRDQALTVVSNLSEIKMEVTNALNKSRNVIVSNPNFFGSSTNYLVQAMANIENRINAAVEEILVAIQNAINATIEHYENTAGRIAQAFAAQV